ncbi:MAG: conserved membrane protein of unknown function [Candidatus Thorarchaeota archaeon]|nr:MAG: conserved membrane protein of unknown function [Candidatus Thorarchaeota archaeon]
MINELIGPLHWVLLSGLLGMFISGIFSKKLQLERRFFLIPYVIIMSIFLYSFFSLNNISFLNLIIENSMYGIIVGIIVGGILVKTVQNQPISRTSTGNKLLGEVLWFGIIYGFIDALLLNVIPVITIWNGFEIMGLTSIWWGMIIALVTSFTASMFVTFMYHIGYDEFRNKSIGFVIIGNSIITIAYIISLNPLGAILSHVIMHIAAVYQGPKTTLQLPPHHE